MSKIHIASPLILMVLIFLNTVNDNNAPTPIPFHENKTKNIYYKSCPSFETI